MGRDIGADLRAVWGTGRGMCRTWPRLAWRGSAQLLSGGHVAILALGGFLLTIGVVSSSPVFGVLLLPATRAVNRAIATIERRRVGDLLGTPVVHRYLPVLDPTKPQPTGSVRRWLAMTMRVLTDRTTYRDAGWVMAFGPIGTLLALLVLGLWAAAAGAVVATLYWLVVPGAALAWLLPAFAAPMTLLALRALPVLANALARFSMRMLSEPATTRLAARVAELTESRTGALAAHGAELRRIERDLHDGIQAQLVSIALRLGIAERRMATDPEFAGSLVRQAREGAEAAMGELRGLIRGLYPPILADRGLAEAVAALAARSPVPVAVTMRERDTVSAVPGRLPAAVEAAAYFTVSEALTNIAKHSGAERASLDLRRDNGFLVISVADDGAGGVDESKGTGVRGIRRRIAAFDGHVTLTSPAGGPTVLTVRLPCPLENEVL